jgi:hypothetical protein
MSTRIKSALLMMLLIVAAGQANGGCPLLASFLQPGAASPFPAIPDGSILLVMVNQSNLPVVVDGVFRSNGRTVRTTTRLLAPEGVEATARVIRTIAEEIVVTARIASPADGSVLAKYVSGFVLAQTRFVRGVDYEDQGEIHFSIPPPPPDCNDNGTPDRAEVAAGAVADCDGNGVPDPCEIGRPTIQQCAGDLIVPADAYGRGEVPDLIPLLVAVDNCTPVEELRFEQDVPPGTPLVLNTATSVDLTVTDGEGNATQCRSTVTLRDVTAPTLRCPEEYVVITTSPRPVAPDLSAVVEAQDNVTSLEAMSISQSIAAGERIPIGVTVITVTVADEAGNSVSCDIAVRVRIDTDPVE